MKTTLINVNLKSADIQKIKSVKFNMREYMEVYNGDATGSVSDDMVDLDLEVL